jgi:hypothetical protein
MLNTGATPVTNYTGGYLKTIKTPHGLMMAIRLCGSNPLDGNTENTLALQDSRVQDFFMLAKRTNRKILVLWDSEPHVIIARGKQSIFRWLNEHLRRFDIDFNQLTLTTQNWAIEECYADWRKLNNTPEHEKFNVEFVWTAARLFAEKRAMKFDAYKGEKDTHFTCMNGRSRGIRRLMQSEMNDMGFNKPEVKQKHITTYYYSLEEEINPIEQKEMVHRMRTEGHANPHSEELKQTLLRSCVSFTQDFLQFEELNYNDSELYGDWWKERCISEKTLRNIYFAQPFILYSDFGAYNFLHKQGFKTFDGILFDESFDSIEDDTLRLRAILSELQRLLAMDIANVQALVKSDAVIDILNHNKELLLDIGSKTMNTEIPDQQVINTVYRGQAT